jgi:hypothetical protein
MPFSAPLPVPTMMAVGVASPRAQGHAITTTAVAARSDATSQPWFPASVSIGANRAAAVAGSGVLPKIAGPAKNQNRNVVADAAMTPGTKTALMRSANRCMGAFDA